MNSKMNSLLKIGAAGAAIYGLSKGLQNGTIQKIPKQVSNVVQSTMNHQSVQQFTNQVQSVFNGSNENSPDGSSKSNLQQPTEMYQPIEIASQNTNVNPENMPENGC